jgi:catechol-2,3-dioxygenase
MVLVKSDSLHNPHASFELKDDAAFDSALAQLAAAGVAVTHSVQEAWKRSFFLSDLDGMQVEYQLRRRGDPETRAHAAAYLV